MKKQLLSFGLVVLGMSVMAQSPRMSLYEEFSGETCPPCASTNPGLNALLHLPVNVAKIIPIKWEVPIPNAPSTSWSLYQTNKAEIDWRYRSTASGGYGYPSQNTSAAAITSGINSAPSGRIDGQHQWVFGASSDHPANLSSTHIANAQAIPAPFQVDMTRDWNANGTAVIVSVTITASQNFNAVGSLVFRTVMVEKEIHFATAPGGTSEKDFYDPAIKSFPSIQAGTPMASNWTNGQQMTFSLSCTIPSYCRSKEQIAMVGFIQDDGDRKVHQAVRADKAPLKNDAKAISAFVDVTCTNMIQPEITVLNNGTDPITAMTITPYSDATVGTPFFWTGNLASNSSTTIPLGNVATATTSGAHTFSYNITAMNAADFNTTNNGAKVTYMVAGNAPKASPVAEGFLFGAFPPATWTNINPDNGIGWKRSSVYGGYNLTTNSAMIELYNNTSIGDKDELILPPMDLEGPEAPEMFFDVAYAQQTGTEADQLDVFASDDCGQNWTNVYSKAGTLLSTGGPVAGVFNPGAADWRTEIVDMSAFAKKKVLVKFVVTNANGSTLYLDNVNLYQKNPTGVKSLNAINTTVAVYPNPANTTATIKVVSSKEGMANVTVVNLLGEVVYSNDLNVTTGVNTLDVDVKSLASGVYNVVVNVDNTSITRKLTVTK